MRSRGQLEIAMLGSSSWKPYAPQGAEGTDNDDNNDASGEEALTSANPYTTGLPKSAESTFLSSVP